MFKIQKGRGECLVSYAPIFTSLPTIVLVFNDFQFLKKKKKIFFFLKKKKNKKKKNNKLEVDKFFYSRNRVECVVSYELIF